MSTRLCNYKDRLFGVKQHTDGKAHRRRRTRILVNNKTNNMQLQVATRKRVKIKMSIASPTGFGKTYSALLLAHGITGDWSKIAVIDSENESASLYSDLGKYFTIDMKPPYTVDKFCQAVKMCVDGGIEVIIVDSTYHYWHGKGGLLEYNNSLGGRYQDWAKTNPLYAKWLNTILQTPAHFICTSRKKQAYEMVKTDGKVTVEKKGMEDEIRSGFDYEMTIAFNIVNAGHMAETGKDRTRLFEGKPEFVITSETGKLVKQWCEEGIEAPPIVDTPPSKPKSPLTEKSFAALIKKAEACKTTEEVEGLQKQISDTLVLTDEQSLKFVEVIGNLSLL